MKEKKKSSIPGQIVKVLYSPQEAFGEVIRNPRYIGPILIMVLFAAAYTGTLYTAWSRTYDEQTLPLESQMDEWTENITRWIWNSNARVAESEDALSGGRYGSKSIEFSVDNDTQTWMQLNYSDPIDCQGIQGYKGISFRVKPIYPDTILLRNASIRLFSSQVDYFYYDLTSRFAGSAKNVWNNLSLQVGPESGWVAHGSSPNWGSITSFGLDFAWSENTNATVRLDGLFFRGVFKSFVEDISSFISSVPINGFMQFTIRWVFLAVLLYVVSLGIGTKTVWRTLLILAGFTLMTMVIDTLIDCVAYANTPAMYRPLELIGGVEGERQIALNSLYEEIAVTSQILWYKFLATLAWNIGLCTVAIRQLTEVSWAKSLIVGAVASATSVFIVIFLIGF